VAESHYAVITTTDSSEAAEELGRGIVEGRLGACVQIVGPIRSIYRWEGGVQNDQEWQCWVKTGSTRSLNTSRRIIPTTHWKSSLYRLSVVVTSTCRGLPTRPDLLEQRRALPAQS
jgi:uncharacterized protein involved in tolerance to divalent cations